MKRCGLLGRKLGHSYSPLIHSMLADYPYELFEREPEALEAFLKDGDWTGINVTIPYKKAVVPYCAELSPLARALGSVNTLVRRPDGSLYGDNTDDWGFEKMALRLGVAYQGKKALILGSGGASVTARAVMQALGAETVVISRSGEDNYDNLERHSDAQILVNTTPVGMFPNNGAAPLDLDRLPALEAVMDVIYNPARTALILQAEAKGIPCESGLYMLVAQAVRAAEQFSGRTVPQPELERVWKAVGNQMRNLVLIGMPGAGKSTVGAVLAAQTGRMLVDADEEIARRIGMSIPEYFAAYGEEAVRRQETQVLAELGKQSGLIIATGGGCVTRPENYPLLHQNGVLIWLKRELDALPTDGRPVSQRDGVAAIYEKRKALYQRFADMETENSGTPESAAAEILAALG